MEDIPTPGTHAESPKQLRSFSLSEDAAVAEQCIVTLAEALSEDAVGCFFTTENTPASGQFWQELLRGTARINLLAQQFFCLTDFSAAAIVVEYPRDGASPWALLLRLVSTTPLKMWRALASFLNSLERQKAAFSKTHGNFMYVLALSSKQPPEGSESLDAPASTVLSAVCAAADKAQMLVYIEARPHQRAWLRGHGFYDIMGYQHPKKGAPMLYIMARAPTPPPQRNSSPSRRRRGARPPP